MRIEQRLPEAGEGDLVEIGEACIDQSLRFFHIHEAGVHCGTIAVLPGADHTAELAVIGHLEHEGGRPGLLD